MTSISFPPIKSKPTKKSPSLTSCGLVKDGLFLVGLDLMGGKLIEVNVCSPGGFVEINQNKDYKIQKSVLDFVEETRNK